MNKVQKLIDDYGYSWGGVMSRPDCLEHMMNGEDGWYDQDRHNPSLLIHCLWEDGNILDKDLEWELQQVNDKNRTDGFVPEFVKDTIKFIKSLQEIPEDERLDEWNMDRYPDIIRRTEIIRLYKPEYRSK